MIAISKYRSLDPGGLHLPAVCQLSGCYCYERLLGNTADGGVISVSTQQHAGKPVPNVGMNSSGVLFFANRLASCRHCLVERRLVIDPGTAWSLRRAPSFADKSSRTGDDGISFIALNYLARIDASPARSHLPRPSVLAALLPGCAGCTWQRHRYLRGILASVGDCEGKLSARSRGGPA